LPELGVYLANALIPTTDAIKITGQRRDALQRGLQVDFRVLSADARAWPRWTGVLLFGLWLALLLPQLSRVSRRRASSLPFQGAEDGLLRRERENAFGGTQSD
jgi:hypothetical protein